VTAPLRDVVEVRELSGPKGGLVFVHQLSCGCLVWQRRKRPAKQLRCVACWWRAKEQEQEHSPPFAASRSSRGP
jgi:hypothetical protein